MFAKSPNVGRGRPLGKLNKMNLPACPFAACWGALCARKYIKTEDDRVAAVTGVGGFIPREELDASPGATNAGVDTLLRGNFYVVVKYRLNETVRFSSATYYQPATGDFQDFLALEQASLQVKLTDRLDLSFSLEITHDSHPPQFVDQTDVICRTGIEYQF